MIRNNSPKIAIIIPAYNESATISRVIATISKYGLPIVINDGSADNTKSKAKSAGALVVSLEKNHGYDQAIAIGITKAIAENFDYAITIDGDGQHEATSIKQFVEKLINDADLVIGVRSSFQRPAELIFAELAKRLWGITDPLCGLKGYRLSKFKLFGCLTTYKSIGTELTIRAVRSGWNVQEVSIKTRSRRDKSRFGSGWPANWRIIRAMITGLLRARGL